MQRLVRREVLVPVIAVLLVGLLGLGWVIADKLTAPTPVEQGVVLDNVVRDADAPATTAQEVAAGSSVTLAPTSTFAAAAVPGGQTQGQVQQQAEPEPTLTTTSQAGVPAPPVQPQPTTTTYTPSVPWCYHPEHGWFSGEGQGCHSGNPYFVEYR